MLLGRSSTGPDREWRLYGMVFSENTLTGQIFELRRAADAQLAAQQETNGLLFALLHAVAPEAAQQVAIVSAASSALPGCRSAAWTVRS